jgi:hypothetical protein
MTHQEKNMDMRMNRKQVSFSTSKEHDAKEKEYWSKAPVEEKLRTITYLRECFYGPEATSGRLQRLYSFSKYK